MCGQRIAQIAQLHEIAIDIEQTQNGIWWDVFMALHNNTRTSSHIRPLRNQSKRPLNELKSQFVMVLVYDSHSLRNDWRFLTNLSWCNFSIMLLIANQSLYAQADILQLTNDARSVAGVQYNRKLQFASWKLRSFVESELLLLLLLHCVINSQ